MAILALWSLELSWDNFLHDMPPDRELRSSTVNPSCPVTSSRSFEKDSARKSSFYRPVQESSTTSLMVLYLVYYFVKIVLAANHSVSLFSLLKYESLVWWNHRSAWGIIIFFPTLREYCSYNRFYKRHKAVLVESNVLFYIFYSEIICRKT